MSTPDRQTGYPHGLESRRPGYDYYVIYPDGARSRFMDKYTAEDYASIFGGTVHKVYDPRESMTWTNGLFVGTLGGVLLCIFAALMTIWKLKGGW